MAKIDDKTASTKEASGILVYLVEELGDARLRASQLKQYVAQALELVEDSEKKDHIHEVAANLLHGIPETLFKLDKSLDAAAMAASRMDYEEIKQGLKPEKAEELERVLEDVRLQYLKRRSTPEDKPMSEIAKTAAPRPKDTREAILDYLLNSLEYAESPREEVDGLVGEGLDEAVAKDIIKEWHKERPHEVGLGNVMLTQRLTEKLVDRVLRKHRPPAVIYQLASNAKTAAESLEQMAILTDIDGKIPSDKLAHLIGQLEQGQKQASKKDPAVFFREAAEYLRSTPNPSRRELAATLRRVLADNLDTQAAEETWAGAGEDFKKHNPDISDEAVKKIDEMHEKHKDVVKGKEAAEDMPLSGVALQKFEAAFDAAKFARANAQQQKSRKAAFFGLSALQSLAEAISLMAPTYADKISTVAERVMQLRQAIITDVSRADVLEAPGAATEVDYDDFNAPWSRHHYAAGIEDNYGLEVTAARPDACPSRDSSPGAPHEFERDRKRGFVCVFCGVSKDASKAASDDYGLTASEDMWAEEDKAARYEKGKPADPTENMSPEDAAEWEQNTQQYGDKFKSATYARTATQIIKVPGASGRYGYIATYRGRSVEVYADTTLQAQEAAAKFFKARKTYEVDVMLAEKNGKPVVHDPSVL